MGKNQQGMEAFDERIHEHISTAKDQVRHQTGQGTQAPKGTRW
jgi:hypothetical protein